MVPSGEIATVHTSAMGWLTSGESALPLLAPDHVTVARLSTV